MNSTDELGTILARWLPMGQSGLLPVLIEAQEKYGWLSQETMTRVATELKVPLAEAYGVADFYSHLYTEPVGKVIVRVCDDVPCYIAGSERVIATLENKLKIRIGATTPDGKVTLEVVPCLGHCDHAPVVMVGEQVHGNVTDSTIENILESQ